ncbi:synaptotagmin-4-like isoform X2 [Phoenix dactylifera]|uniref:Synaptotagmin-4-like isoform X2 n=1 Tax=Phoenix dactylifera TaxID=42345 RepID=A0A8B8ZB90_PHODC|nr:synaptotagmin-4-like isoform X2 [Phoenix dactylifera]
MLVPRDSFGLALSQVRWRSPLVFPDKLGGGGIGYRRRRRKGLSFGLGLGEIRRCGSQCEACMPPAENKNSNLDIEFLKSTRKSVRAQKHIVAKQFSNELDYEESEPMQLASSFTNCQEDPLVDKLRTQLGVIHPIPSPPINRSIVGFFVLFFFVGVIFDKIWTFRKRNKSSQDVRNGTWPQVPTSFSLFLEKDLQRKESVEWVNMVLGKLWKVYRSGLENWIVGSVQPVIDDLRKPDYVQRVELKQFSLGDEPLSVRNVERRTSRRVNDLQYQIGLRYTGGARMLLSLSLKFEPWVGAVSWAFVSLPKIKFVLSPFRLFNLMAIPVISMFLTKLLTEDLPRLFVRPKKIVLDFQKGKALGPFSDDSKTDAIQEGNKDFVGELSVTLVDAQKLAYVIFGKTDPYVVLSLGDQVIRSKKNSQTTVIGPPGEPIWNQDFHMLVVNPRKQKLYIQVKDSFGFMDFTIGTGEVELGSLQDTVPTDRIVALQGGWGLFRNRSSGEILLHLTYKAYVEDEEDDNVKTEYADGDASDDEMLDYEHANGTSGQSKSDPDEKERESFMDVLAALLVSEEFQGIVASETGIPKIPEESNYSESTISRARGRNAETSRLEPDSVSSGVRESTLVWLAVITTIAVLISINVGGSSFFNP